MIIENEGHRNNLMEALSEVCEAITISGIYQGNKSDVQEEAYETHVIRPSVDSSSIIIGYFVFIPVKWRKFISRKPMITDFCNLPC